MNRKTTLAALAALLLTAGTASAAPPPVFTYGGFLLDGAGNPVATPTNLTFRFHDAVSGGSQLGTDDVVAVDPGADGYFTAIVGIGVTGFPALFGGQVYMSIQAQGDALPMDPRIAITSVPSALAVDFGGISGWPSQTCTGYVKEIGSDGLAVCDSAPPLTGVSAGTGITASVTGGTVALSVDTAAIQARISAAGCASGSSIRVVNANGTVVCQTDTAGTGTVTGVTGTAPISVTTSATTPAVSLTTCLANQVYKMNVGGTAWACAADANSGGTVTSITAGNGLTGGIITGTGTIALNSTYSPTFAGLTLTGTASIGWEIVTGSAVSIPAGSFTSASATCPTGKKVLGGGCYAAGTSYNDVAIANTQPQSTGNGWFCAAKASVAGNSLTPYAICARVGP